MAKSEYQYTLKGDTAIVYGVNGEKELLPLDFRSESMPADIHQIYQDAELHFLMNFVGENAPALTAIEVSLPAQPRVDVYIGYSGVWHMELVK